MFFGKIIFRPREMPPFCREGRNVPVFSPKRRRRSHLCFSYGGGRSARTDEADARPEMPRVKPTPYFTTPSPELGQAAARPYKIRGLLPFGKKAAE
jgi:hypothetical protein